MTYIEKARERIKQHWIEKKGSITIEEANYISGLSAEDISEYIDCDYCPMVDICSEVGDGCMDTYCDYGNLDFE